MRLSIGIFMCLGLIVAVPSRVDAELIWIEGEAASQHTMHRHDWYDSVDRNNLSAGDWLSHFAAGEPPVAEYRFQVQTAGNYEFWVRCNTVAAAHLSYRLDDDPWQSIDGSHPLELTNIAADGKPDLRFIAWVRVDQVPLRSGEHQVRFRFESANNRHGAIDCFLFSSGAFRPRGALRPGQRSNNANPGFFAWEPDIDRFSADALVDLSRLNEDIAGAQGRVRAVDGGFALGDQRSVKFWATNAGPAIWGLDHESHVYLAKRLAKTGVNMVRLHGPIYGAQNPAVDRERLDRLHHLVYALKNEGIYVSLSFYFPLWFNLEDSRNSFMLLFFDSQMQDIYRAWAKELLTTSNPYTHLPLGEDPAVAIVEMINEDSHFFWTFSQNNMSADRWQNFMAMYGDWLARKYATLDQAIAAWGEVREPGDDLTHGRVALYDAWMMTREGIQANAPKRARIRDQVQFLTENMRGFYEDTIAYFRTSCRYDGLVSCGNWHVTDASMLDALERYCYTAGDVIDHHGYFDHGHQGDGATYAIRPGQEFSSQTALQLKHPNPLPFVETEGYPHIISEVGWPAPNMYRAEFTFLASAYGNLLGLDGIYSFAIGSASWDQQLNKFPVNTPTVLGCFPAAALIYRRGDVQEGPIVVHDVLRLPDLFALSGTCVHAQGSLDELRATSIPAGQRRQGVVPGIDPLTFYVGRVVRSFTGAPEDSFQISMANLIDHDRNTIRSITGELVWNHEQGVVTMDTPRAQGAVGFLGRIGPVSLTDVTIAMRNDYGSLTIVALDDKPIKESNKLLIQTMTIEQPYQFKATGVGNLSGRIESVGSAPLGVENFDARVTLKLTGSRPVRVVACDEHGYARTTSVQSAGGPSELQLVLDPSSPYHIVQR